MLHEMPMLHEMMERVLESAQDMPPEVRISAEREGSYWRLRVSDNGEGFDPRYANLIFQMFQRLHGRAAHHVATFAIAGLKDGARLYLLAFSI